MFATMLQCGDAALLKHDRLSAHMLVGDGRSNLRLKGNFLC